MTNEELTEIKLAWAHGEEVQYLHVTGWKDWGKDHWINVEHYPTWRVKPKTIRIGEYDVPEPVWNVESLTHAYLVDISRYDYCVETIVTNPTQWGGILKRGIVHSTREAAELHAKALLSFTEQK